MSSFLTEVKGFTPLIEIMVKEVGLIQAAVYGVVWRYCQRKDGVCTASHETLAEALGLSRGTVQRHIKELCQAGYLRDTTPERKNRPHVYADTGRAQIVGLLEAKVTVSEKDSTVSEKDTQVYQKSTRGECESTQETHGADAPTPPSEEKEETPAEPKGEDLLIATFGERPQREPVQETPHWKEQMADERALWGFDSSEFQRQLKQYGDDGRSVRLLGYEFEKLTGLHPIWADKKAVKRWSSGLWTCLQEARGDPGIVLQAASELLAAELTVSSPWSVREKTRALAALGSRESKHNVPAMV